MFCALPHQFGFSIGASRCVLFLLVSRLFCFVIAWAFSPCSRPSPTVILSFYLDCLLFLVTLFSLVFDDVALFQSFIFFLRRTWTNNNLHDFDDDQLALLFVFVAIPSSIIVIGNLGIEGRGKKNKFEEKEGQNSVLEEKLEQRRESIVRSQSSKHHARNTPFTNHDNPVAR